MRKLYPKSALVLLLLLCSMFSNAQDFSNKGKDFWVAYGYHERMGQANGGSQDMVLYFAAEQAATVTVSIPGVGYTQNYTVPANSVVTSATIPKIPPQDVRLTATSTAPENKGIRITSDKPIVAYAHIYNQSVSGATILFPTPTLGKEYYSINYQNTSNTNNANCWFYVIAADTGVTRVEIIPSAATTNGWAAGSTNTITLTQGQVFNVMGQLTTTTNPFQGVDLTGSVIRSVAGANGSCKRIAVFSGSGRISITCNAASSSSDNYMVQAFPKSAWGKKFLTASTAGNQQNNIYRVCVSDPTAVVTLNGAPIGLPLQNNFYYQIASSNTPKLIEADKPITVAQYMTSQGACGNGGQPGDPEVIYLSSVEQNISKVLWNATPNFQILQHYFNVIIPNTGTAISSFTLDGVPVPAASFTPHPQAPGFSYLRQSVTAGQHIIQSDSGFNAIAYGYGNAESYGYNAGTNIKDIFQFISLQNQYATVNFPATCRSTPFYFSMTFPYQPTQIQWIFGPLLNAMGIADVTLPNPVPTSTIIVGGKTLYVYQLPTPYTITTIGTYPIRVVASNPTPDGCGGTQEIDFEVQVFDPPVADFTFNNACFPDPVQFNDNSNTGGRPIISRYWDFGDLTNSTVASPSHVYPAPGPYTARYAVITDVGCLSDTTSHIVTVSPLPTATISGNAIVCLNSTSPNITFTGAVGTAPYTFTYNINGGPNQTVTTTSGNSVTVAVPTGTVGTFTYNLVSVSDASPAVCSQAQTGSATITVNALPTATISGATTVCLNGTSPNITFTGAVGTAPYTFTYNINGGANQTVSTTSGNSVTVAVPTATAGTFTYNLVSVQEGSTQLCSQAQTGSVIVNVSPLPTASIAGNTTVCLNGTSPQITFTGANGASPFTFTYNINGGTNQTVTTTSGNSVTVSVPTSVTGTFTYNLVSVQEGSAQLCSQAQTGSAIVTVSPLPTANISGTATVCLNAPSPDITFTGAVGTPPFTFTYNINGGASQTVTTTSGNSVTVPVPTNTAGTFTYNLLSVQEGSGITCSQVQTGSATVTVNPLPTASIAGSTAVCVNSTSPLITFTGAVGTAPYTFTYNINGGPNQTVTTSSGNSVTVPVPTTTAGTFAYNLIGVQEGSANLCSQAQSGTATIIVNPLPTASIAGATEVCLNAPSPLVTFTGASGTAPYTFTYNINGGANQTVSTTAGNSVTVPVPTVTAGTFTYNLISVQDGSSTLCTQAQSGSVSVIVNPLPTSNFTVNAPSCETRTISFTDISSPNAGVITNWLWNFDDPASGPANTSTLQNPTHIFATAGTYNVSLIVTTDKGCVSVNPPRQVVINERPLAGFIIPEVCLSDTYAQFTDTSRVPAPDNIVAWSWNFGDPPSGPANVSVLQNPQHSYTATGNYNVELIATSNLGCKDTIVQVLTVNGSFPVANFTIPNPTTLCANDSVAIVEASTVFPGSITKVEIYWDNVNQPAVFDTDNFPVPGKVYKHLYPNFQAPLTRSFTIRYRAYSGGVCVNDRIQTITVNAAPKVQFNNLPDICYDAAPYQIPPSIASEIGGVPGNGIFSGPGVSPTGVFNPGTVGPGTYSIKYTFTSTAGGCVDSLSKTITVRDTATARFTVQPVICERSAISFNSTTSTIPPAAGTITGWLWNFGDPASGAANTSSLQNPAHTFTSWGTYTVSLTVISSNGCRSTVYAAPVFVNPLPRPRFTFPASSCLPSANVQFTNTSAIPDGTQASFSYLWNFGDPPSGALNTSTGTSPSHIYNSVGPFNVNLQVTSGAGCIRDTTITLNTIHPQPTGSFTVNKPDVCVGQSFQFTDNSNPADGTTTQWNWTMGDGNVRTIPAFSYTYGSAGSYDVSLYITNSFGCRSTTFNQTLTVNPYPIVDAGPDLFILEDGSDTLKALVNAINPSYLWTPNLYFLSSNTVQNPVVKGVDDIWYTLTVTGRGGCQQTDRVFVKVLKGPEIPNIFSPNGDGVHDKWIINYLDTYPGCTVEIFNRYGQRIFSSTGYGQPWDGTVNGKPVPIGTYYFIVNPKNGRSIMSGYVDVIR